MQQLDVTWLISAACYIGAGVGRDSASAASRHVPETYEAGFGVPWWLGYFPSEGRNLAGVHNQRQLHHGPDYYASKTRGFLCFQKHITSTKPRVV
jgi:hypothetical protein